MRWEDERYVRVYVRDTADWLALGWEAQSLLVLTMRKVDRAGLLELGRAGVRGLAAVVGMPLDVVERALSVLLEDGCVVLNGSTLCIPNFIEAQEAAQSDAHRKRESRARARDRASAAGRVESRNVTDTGRNVTADPDSVTPGHVASQPVTPNCAVPSRAVPKEEAPPLARERARGEGERLDPEAEQRSSAARHETASGSSRSPEPELPAKSDVVRLPTKHQAYASENPATARLLAELESLGSPGAWPSTGDTRRVVETAIGDQDVAKVAPRVAEAIRASGKPWLGHHVDAIRPPARRRQTLGDLGGELYPWPTKLTAEERVRARAELVAIAGPDFELAPLQATGDPSLHPVEAIREFQDRWRAVVAGRP